MSQGPGASVRATGIGVVAILLWAALALFTARTRGVPPFELLFLTFAVAFAGGLVLVWMRGGFARMRQPWPVWATGFGGIFGYHALYFTALNAAPPAEASLIAYLWPLLIVLLAAALPAPGGAGDRRLRPRHLIGAALGLAGTALILLGGRTGGIGPGNIGMGGSALGYGAAFGCAVVWAGYSVLNRRFPGVPSDVICGICGAVALAGLACHVALERPVRPDAGQWAAILALGIGPVGLAFYAWDHATKHGQLALLGTLSYLAPLLSTLLLIATGEAQASAAILLAAVLVIAGAAVAAWPGRRSGP